MNVLELLAELGLPAKRTSSTKGGEYHSPCPRCEGSDRFCLWPNDDRNGHYWCRQCLCAGDAIQFCRDFMGMSFQEACTKVGVQVPEKTNHLSFVRNHNFMPRITAQPSEPWIQKSTAFIESCHRYLCEHQYLLNHEKDRGLNFQTILRMKLGWNSREVFDSRDSWGLISEESSAQKNRLCLPKGIVIPLFRNGNSVQVKIRRHGWQSGDSFPKYHIVAGSSVCPAVYGDISKPCVIIEAELDAMLVYQLAGDLCCCIAVGGVSNRPDQIVHQLLHKAPCILFSLDFDDAGKNAYQFWRSTYSNLKPWPVPKGKSPGDAYQLGVDLRKWIEIGLGGAM